MKSALVAPAPAWGAAGEPTQGCVPTGGGGNECPWWVGAVGLDTKPAVIARVRREEGRESIHFAGVRGPHCQGVACGSHVSHAGFLSPVSVPSGCCGQGAWREAAACGPPADVHVALRVGDALSSSVVKDRGASP